jgi:RNA polymerase primary sigma factor
MEITTRRNSEHESRSLACYFVEVGRIELLSPEEELDLGRRIRRGDEQAMHTLIKSNLRFVVSIAKQFQNLGLDLEDLIAEGNVGLLNAAERFDVERGFRFISYAVWWIRQSILVALGEHSRTIRLPMNQVDMLRRIRKASTFLEQEFGRDARANELAQELNVSMSEVSDTLAISGRSLSLDAPFVEGEENGLLDVTEQHHEPAPDNELMKESLLREIEHLLSTLSDREAEVLRLSFGIGHERSMTLAEIGGRFELTRERVRQIRGQAIHRLRNSSRSTNLRIYLG